MSDIFEEHAEQITRLAESIRDWKLESLTYDDAKRVFAKAATTLFEQAHMVIQIGKHQRGFKSEIAKRDAQIQELTEQLAAYQNQ